ncbi:ABC transporter permease [Christensenella intestinihominis]|uniref:ABC transporter permease n=1 Tax=Christensenella intestinihominis TaxID=1851429 RepID=UPI00082A1E78|nr:ABC transporter permease [Christensenella intestinihominis]
MNENVKGHAASGRGSVKNYYMLIVFAALVVIFSIASPTFLTGQNWSNLLIVQVTTGCMALGAMSILILGEFDLSLGYMVSFCMMLGAILSENGANAFVVIAAMVLAGAAFGLVSGVLTVKFKVNSFISTLGVGMLMNGLTQAISNGEVHSSGIPDFITEMGQGKFLGIGYSFWILIGLAVVMYFVLNHTTFGRSLYAVGGSQKVAFMAGINTDKVRILAFVLSAAFTGLAAVFQLGQSGAANPSFGFSLLMPAYAIVFLAATSFSLGTYNVPGLLLAIVLLGVGTNGIQMIGAPSWAEFVYNGGILIVAIFLVNKSTKAQRRLVQKQPESR